MRARVSRYRAELRGDAGDNMVDGLMVYSVQQQQDAAVADFDR